MEYVIKQLEKSDIKQSIEILNDVVIEGIMLKFKL